MNAGRILAALAMMTVASTASAQNTQLVNIAVNAISQVAVTGGPQSLTISTAVAGNALTNATASVTWAVTTNQTNQKLTASIDQNMPAGLTLQVQAEAPLGGGLSTGPNALSTTAADLVSGFSQLAESGLDLTYTLAATLTAAVGSMNRTVTYTVIAGP